MNNVDFLNLTHRYAVEKSGCLKVAVGSLIVGDNNRIVSAGTNLAVPDFCRHEGCLRILKFGDDSKNHRGPTDCRAIHSEIHALITAGEPVKGMTMYITRYPCEGCARAIAVAGISKVVYGRQQEISEMTAEIFDVYNIEVVWAKEFDAEDTTR